MVSSLFNRSWFSRRWVLQEVYVAANVQMLCAGETLPWTYLYIGVEALSYMTHLGRINELRDLCTLVNRRGLWLREQPGKSTVLQLMRRFSTFECTDPRDRIAAMKGLWSGGPSIMSYNVDYGRSVKENYARFAFTLAKSGDCEEVLWSAAQRSQTHPHSPGLPSWVPDWRLPPSPLTLTRASILRSSSSCFALSAHAKGVKLQMRMLDVVQNVDALQTTEGHVSRCRLKTLKRLDVTAPLCSTEGEQCKSNRASPGDYLYMVAATSPSLVLLLRRFADAYVRFVLICECHVLQFENEKHQHDVYGTLGRAEDIYLC